MAKKINSDYRKYYEEMTGEPIPKGYEVHHIDHDRKNNSIDNLVALPRSLHKKYHLSYKDVNFYLDHNAFDRLWPMNAINGVPRYYMAYEAIDAINKHLDICKEISQYISSRCIQTAGGYFEALEDYFMNVGKN